MAETPSLAEFTGNCADLDREAYTLRVHVASKQKLKAGWADYATRMLSVRRLYGRLSKSGSFLGSLLIIRPPSLQGTHKGTMAVTTYNMKLGESILGILV